ncbi:MAG: hypothetical protein EGR16_06740 [Clostridiales bacterium]|nr:hypothetical protein [Clostridiales bacterium]
MESAYSLALAELENTRKKNADELERRKAEIRRAVPEFSDIERQLTACGASLARCVLNGGAGIEIIKQRIADARLKRAEILKKLSLPDNYLDEIYSCKLCRDTGYDENGRRCECHKRLISKYIGINSNLTDAMRHQTFDSFNFSLFENQPDVKGRPVIKLIKSAYNKSLEMANSFEVSHSNIFFYGSSGTGKTYLSSCIANRVLQRGFTVCYQSAFKMLDMLEKLKFGRYDEDERTNAEYEAKYFYDVDLLIIDDVGTEFITAYSSAALFDIINSRLVEGKSTIISSNLTPVKIGDMYGGRMLSRIAGAYTAIPVEGVDLRLINKIK